jgi:hypothetical protein
MTGGKRPKKGGKRQVQPGVWNRDFRRGPTNPIRVRTKRLDEIDSDKIALAYWLLAKQIVEDESDQQLSEDEVRRVAAQVEQVPPRSATRSKGRGGKTPGSRGRP